MGLYCVCSILLTRRLLFTAADIDGRWFAESGFGNGCFANSVEADGVLTMPLDLANAIVVEAHRTGKPVFAHVSTAKPLRY